jgi:hypothetical protein
MATTAIIAEILIIGLQALTWLILLVLGIRTESDAGTWLVDLGPLSVVVALAASYVLGVVIDRVSDSLIDNAGIEAALRLKGKKARVADTLELGAKRMAVMAHENAIGTFLEYQRSRLRIIRSTFVNIAVSILIVPFFVIRRGPGWKQEWAPVVLTVSFLLIALSLTWYVYVRIYRAYMSRLDDAHNEVKRQQGTR